MRSIKRKSQRKKAKQQKPKPGHWQPLVAANATQESVDLARSMGTYEPGEEVWINNLYTVIYRDIKGDPEDLAAVDMTHLSIRRNDRRPVTDWRHKQMIKNQLCGPEREAVEVYPAESRLVDASNQFHLWVYPEGHRLPFGYKARAVMAGGHSKIGSVQRSFEPGLEPADAIQPEQYAKLVEAITLQESESTHKTGE